MRWAALALGETLETVGMMLANQLLQTHIVIAPAEKKDKQN